MLQAVTQGNYWMRRRCLAILLLLALAPVTGMADEYRLYRIIGSELELYRRIELEPDTASTPVSLYEMEIPQLRAAGLYDVRPEDMADEFRRPLSRGDGLLWDAPRSRWIGFESEASGRLVSLDQNDEERATTILHEFEIVPDAYFQLWPTSDANTCIATLTHYNGDWLPKVTRLQFAENGEIASLETWEMADRDPELMRAVYGTPRPLHEYRSSFFPTVSRKGRVYTVVESITEWDFNVLPPLRVLKQGDVINGYMQCAVSPSGEIVAAVSSRDECCIDLWNATDERPFQSLLLQEGGEWLTGGVVAFTPDGQYLWYDSIFSGHLRVWRCSDWMELDAYRFGDYALFGAMHSAEWITISRDAPFEEEPSEWVHRGPYDPDSPPLAREPNGPHEPDFSTNALLKGLIFGMLQELLIRDDD
jgi:hypothetical protein